MPIPHTAQQIADDIARRIARGEYKRGQKLPSHAELSVEYGSAVRTVTRGLDILKAMGLVVGVPGSGTYVSES